jgi:glycosyltransferase involved in cell wall biosynthesis
MYDCLWYGGGSLKRAWMRFCLGAVDRCIVWASVERQRYAQAYGVSPEKFLYVPHHHTVKRYTFEVGDEGYIFTGGNADRDYGLFFSAVADLSVPCVLATNRPQLLAGLVVPSNVRVVSVSPAEFRQLMARARLVVMPMRATLLHAGGQQTILNAMVMGKAVILTDAEGGADYIEHGKTGLLVPYGDVPALRQAIRYLWEHPEEARAMGELAQRVATPLTTERCNVTIWEHALRLAGEIRPGGVPPVRGREVPGNSRAANSQNRA